jgi:replication factor C subunit 2/4
MSSSTTTTDAVPSSTSLATGVPWVEKYRPLELKDIVGNDATIDRLKIIARDGNLNVY